MYDMRVQLLSSSTAPRLKLYTAINLDKLASFFGMSVEDTISELIVFKNQCIERKKLSDSSQDGFVSAAEVDFYISEVVCAFVSSAMLI